MDKLNINDNNDNNHNYEYSNEYNNQIEEYKNYCMDCGEEIESTNSARQLCGKTFCYN